jgi:acyl-CoA thioesterase FadM
VTAATPERRGQGADWQNPWPPVGVRPGPVLPSAGVDALRADGYAVVFDVDPIDADRDEWQDHLNNRAVVRMMNELRMAYVAARLTPEWPRFLRRGGSMVVVREIHVRYDREGWMHERYVGGMRIAQRRGKAAIVEHALAAAESGERIAAAWLVQLLVGPDGRVTDWPDWYWEMVAAVEGAPVPVVDAAPRVPWGPPAS